MWALSQQQPSRALKGLDMGWYFLPPISGLTQRSQCFLSTAQDLQGTALIAVSLNYNYAELAEQWPIYHCSWKQSPVYQHQWPQAALGETQGSRL